MEPNSRAHWALLTAGVAGGVLFNVTWFVEGLARPGYDAVREPMSALSLGSGGWVQAANFVQFGVLGCINAFAWGPTLRPGLGAIWYPRLRFLVGLAMIGAGVFSQDPDGRYPVGIPAAVSPTAHAVVHSSMAFLSLIAIVGQLLILARRFRREPAWRGWSTAATCCAVLMMAFLALFGALGAFGLFEKLASVIPTLFGLVLMLRLVGRRDARIAGTTPPRDTRIRAEGATSRP